MPQSAKPLVLGRRGFATAAVLSPETRDTWSDFVSNQVEELEKFIEKWNKQFTEARETIVPKKLPEKLRELNLLAKAEVDSFTTSVIQRITNKIADARRQIASQSTSHLNVFAGDRSTESHTLREEMRTMRLTDWLRSLEPDARRDLLLASSAEGDSELIESLQRLSRAERVSLFDESDFGQAKSILAERRNPEAFQTIRGAKEVVENVIFNINTALKAVGDGLAQQWAFGSKSRLDNLMKELASHLTETPSHASSLAQVIEFYNLRPASGARLTTV